MNDVTGKSSFSVFNFTRHYKTKHKSLNSVASGMQYSDNRESCTENNVLETECAKEPTLKNNAPLDQFPDFENELKQRSKFHGIEIRSF